MHALIPSSASSALAPPANIQVRNHTCRGEWRELEAMGSESPGLGRANGGMQGSAPSTEEAGQLSGLGSRGALWAVPALSQLLFSLVW